VCSITSTFDAGSTNEASDDPVDLVCAELLEVWPEVLATAEADETRTTAADLVGEVALAEACEAL